MKRKLIKKLIFLFTIAMSMLSCSKALLLEDNSNGLDGKKGKLFISGIVTDRLTNTPQQDIEISFQCDFPKFEKISVTTGQDGLFLIKAEGFTRSITGCVTARDSKERFLPITRDIKVNWKGESYNPQEGAFAINDCNFQLTMK